MKVYTYTDARAQLAALLDEAGRAGEVRIRRRDGTEYAVIPATVATSPFAAIRGANTRVTREAIVEVVRQGRADVRYAFDRAAAPARVRDVTKRPRKKR